jgi:hypothetical protein
VWSGIHYPYLKRIQNSAPEGRITECSGSIPPCLNLKSSPPFPPTPIPFPPPLFPLPIPPPSPPPSSPPSSSPPFPPPSPFPHFPPPSFPHLPPSPISLPTYYRGATELLQSCYHVTTVSTVSTMSTTATRSTGLLQSCFNFTTKLLQKLCRLYRLYSPTRDFLCNPEFADATEYMSSSHPCLQLWESVGHLWNLE